jgi:hypothetical protein
MPKKDNFDISPMFYLIPLLIPSFLLPTITFGIGKRKEKKRLKIIKQDYFCHGSLTFAMKEHVLYVLP